LRHVPVVKERFYVARGATQASVRPTTNWKRSKLRALQYRKERPSTGAATREELILWGTSQVKNSFTRVKAVKTNATSALLEVENVE